MFPTANYVSCLTILVVYGVLLVDARPINLTTSGSVSPTQFELLTEVDFGGRIHNLIPFPKSYQGKDADYYELGGAGQPAILKVVERNDDSHKRLNAEGFFSKKVGLFLGSTLDKEFFYLALRDVRSRFPHPNSPSLKLAHEWYLEDKTMNVEEMLKSLRDNIERTLVDYVGDIGLFYSHVTFDSIYTDKEFEYIMPVNWGPPIERGGRGVKQRKDIPNVGDFYEELEDIIGEQINIDMLARALEHHGGRLRLADGGSRDTVELNGEEYDLKPLVAQGMFSQAYTIVGGYEDQDTKKTVSAILKIIAGAGNNKIKAETEIGYLKKVGLYLYAKLDEYDFYLIVMRDVRSGFPKKSSPPLKPFYEWYQADKKMDVEKSWKKFRKAIEERLIKFAEKDGLLYNDYHLGNIFVDRKLKVIMPIDWGPPGYAQGQERTGVEEITSQDKKERKKIIKAYKEDLRKKLPEEFNSEKLANLLGTS